MGVRVGEGESKIRAYLSCGAYTKGISFYHLVMLERPHTSDMVVSLGL